MIVSIRVSLKVISLIRIDDLALQLTLGERTLAIGGVIGEKLRKIEIY